MSKQAKRPGSTAKQERQARALARLDSSHPASERESYEMSILRRRIRTMYDTHRQADPEVAPEDS